MAPLVWPPPSGSQVNKLLVAFELPVEDEPAVRGKAEIPIILGFDKTGVL